jgi:hypothetical protein
MREQMPFQIHEEYIFPIDGQTNGFFRWWMIRTRSE